MIYSIRMLILFELKCYSKTGKDIDMEGWVSGTISLFPFSSPYPLFLLPILRPWYLGIPPLEKCSV